MTTIITHRGLDPDRAPYFLESSYEAFRDQLERGFGLEFDARKTADNKLVVAHDATLERLSEGSDTRAIARLSADEICSLSFRGCHLTDLDTLLNLIEEKQSRTAISALHLKSVVQNRATLDSVLAYLEKRVLKNILVFDTTIASAQYLKKHLPQLKIAPSLAHPYDITRYNNTTGGTLLSLDDVLSHRTLFDWVWGDEWDRTGRHGEDKKLYTRETFAALREVGICIALVTPELHGTSPGLTGGEAHPDAESPEKLFSRIEEIITLKPDAVCTDHPDRVRELLKNIDCYH